MHNPSEAHDGLITKYTPKLTICISKLHPSRSVIAWSADNYFFAFNFGTNEWEAKRLSHHTQAIRAIEYNSSSCIWMTAAEDKKIIIWKDKTFEAILECQVDTKITAALFLDDQQIVIADKFGRVFLIFMNEFFKFNHMHKDKSEIDITKEDNIFNKYEDEGKITNWEECITINNLKNKIPIFGHLSIITAMIISQNRKWLITADRDSKVRISRGFDDFQTEAFCFGHENFISSLLIPPTPFDCILITASGDTTIRIFDIKCGTQLDKINLEPKNSNFNLVEENQIIVTNNSNLNRCPTHRWVPSRLFWSPNKTLLILIENFKGFLEIPIMADFHSKSFHFGQYIIHSLPSIPISLIPIIEPSNYFKNTNSCESHGSSIYWVNAKAELKEPTYNDNTTNVPYFNEKWKGVDLGGTIQPSQVYYWKTIKEFGSELYFTRKNSTKRKHNHC